MAPVKSRHSRVQKGQHGSPILGVLLGLTYALVLDITAAMDIVGFPETEREYCNRETFEATCPDGHVIEISQASFGRMPTSRCVSDNIHAPCRVDALPTLHYFCSGRRHCSMDVSEIDKLLENYTRSECHNDYRLHLYATYRCIPVETEPDKTCEVGDQEYPVDVTSADGFLASLTTRETAKGSEQCPWHIRAEPGQTIQISLHNYNTQLSTSGTMCHIYAYIRERALPDSEAKLMDCGYSSAQGKVFTSLSESMDVVLVDPSDDRNFLLHYKALGCPNVKTTEGAEVVRKGNMTIITCNDHTWTLSCRDGEWVGARGDCVSPPDTHEGGFIWPEIWSQEFTIVLIIIVAILIAIIIVVIGVCIVRRHSTRDFQQVSQNVGEYGVYGLRGPVVPSKCYYPTLPLPRDSLCHGSGSESSHYTTTIQRRQAVPPCSVPPSVDGFAPHFLQQTDLTSCASCPVHSCSSRTGTYHDRVGASGWQTFPIRRPDHIYESPKFARKLRHDPPFYHELDPTEVEKQLREQHEKHQLPTQQVTSQQRQEKPPPMEKPQKQCCQNACKVPPIPTEDEVVSDGAEDPLPPPPPPLPPDNAR